MAPTRIIALQTSTAWPWPAYVRYWRPRSPAGRVGVPHFYLHGAAAGATGAMIAMRTAAYRTRTHVDVSCQEAVARTLASAPPAFCYREHRDPASGSYRQTGDTTFMRITGLQRWVVIFSCRWGRGGPERQQLIQWMRKRGSGIRPHRTRLDHHGLRHGHQGTARSRRAACRAFSHEPYEAELFEGR